MMIKASMFCIFALLLFWSDKTLCYYGNANIVRVQLRLSIVNISNSAISPVNVRVPTGTTAFTILQEAAKQHPCYKAEYKSFPGLGRFITSICCVEQVPSDKLYWLIDVNNSPAKVGIDQLIPNNGDHITFKYQKL